MTDARAKAPTLAWLLTALTCLLTGMAIVESRHQAATFPAFPPTGAAETGEAAAALTPMPAPPPSPTALFEGIPVSPSTDPATLRVARLAVPPGSEPQAEVAPGPTVIMVASGTLLVRVDGAVGQGLDAARSETALGAGERLVIAPGARYAVRNDRPTPAEALVVAIVRVATPTPMLGPGEPPPG
jgi:quercetin dioxygenase-like cupin family protein